ncbi:hypothetical protein M885DRAFT_619681 [Pelagophyceae sp. CCMP2097]|nr:hypothetical protein M885DRAFT_619681 [Pelagophyceae sp. CCMP2097]
MAPPPQFDEPQTLYCGNLPYETNEAELLALFRSRDVETLEAKIVRNAYTGQSKGFGFVTRGPAVAADRDVRKSNVLDGYVYKNRKMYVEPKRLGAHPGDDEPRAPPPPAYVAPHPVRRRQRTSTTEKETAKRLNKLLMHYDEADDILAFFEQNVRDFDAVNFSTTFHRLQREAARDSRFQHLVEVTTFRINTYPEKWAPCALASIARSASRLILTAPGLYAAIAKVMLLPVLQVQAWEPRALSDAAFGFAKHHISLASLPKLDAFEPRELCDLIWAFSQIRHDAWPELFEGAAGCVVDKLPGSLNLAAAWASAQASDSAVALSAARFVTGLSSKAVKRPWMPLNASQIAIVAHAYMDRDPPHPALFAAVAAAALHDIGDFPPRSLASIASAFSSHNLTRLICAFATAGAFDEALFLSAAAHAADVLHHESPRSLAELAWAFATLSTASRADHRQPLDALFWAISQHTANAIDRYSPKSLSLIAWAHATVGFVLFTELTRVMDACEFESLDLANAAWSFATLGLGGPFEAIAREALERLGTFDSSSLARLCWAFATAGVVEPELLRALVAEVLHRGDFDVNAKSQLHQCEAPQRKLEFDRGLGKRAADFLATFVAMEPPAAQDTLASISSALSQVGWAHEWEFTTPEGLRLPIAQPLTKQGILLLDPLGTQHLRINVSSFLARTLRSLGWNVVVIKIDTWASWSPEEQVAELKSLLRLM